MDEYCHRRRRRQRRTFTKVIAILLFCMAVLIAAEKLVDSYTYNESTTLRKTNNVISDVVTAANACVIDIGSGFLLYDKGCYEKIAPASTAKMLTALTVLEYCSLDDSVTVGPELDMVAQGSSIAWLYQGDILTAKQLLVALLLPSGNDAAYTLAVHTGKSIAGDDSLSSPRYIDIFMDAMNQKAQDVGATSSNFINPDGYDAQGQYTTAYDLALIAKACLSDGCLAEIVGSFTIYDTWLGGREVTYYNTNELLNPNSTYYYPNAIGLKTGNSTEAGSCLISAAVINAETYICVIMGSVGESRFTDSQIIYFEIERSV